MDPRDRSLLRLLERRVPLLPDPYEAVAEELGREARDVRRDIERLRTAGVIRQISGIFHPRIFGYDQTLAALEVPPDKLDAAGRIVAEHPGVSHCYARRDAWNLWFTLAVSPDSELGLHATIQKLSRLAGAADRMSLPTLRRYKLHVRFVGRDAPCAPVEPQPPPPKDSPGEEVRRGVRALQRDLPSGERPFVPLARSESLEEDRLLRLGRNLEDRGWMRRYSAVLRHRAVGARANVMVAWRCEAEGADEAAAAMCACDAVSHCYLRPATPRWPFPLYTMIHGPDEASCVETVEALARQAGLGERRLLWTEREFRKRRVRLFTGQEQAWEQAHA